MAKKKKHWSAILKVLGACDIGYRFARRQPSLDAAWAKCKHSGWMSWLCEIIAGRFQCSALLWQWDDKRGYPSVDGTKKMAAYWNDHGAPFAAEADLIRKYWPKPPRIPKKLLKEAGLL